MFGKGKKDNLHTAQNTAASKKKRNDKSAASRQMTLKQNREAILNEKTPFVVREAYKTARTNIIFSVSGDDDNDCKVIVFTSANPGEGKTTSSLNMAISFAQTGAKTLIIDCDMRKPRLHQYLGILKTDGLTTILANQKSFSEVIYKNVRPGLDCITSGSIPPNPAELLSSDAMRHLLEDLKLQYDYIIIDTPPVTVVTDASAISKFVRGIVLVVREGYTSHESIEQALSLLKIAKARVLGFFVNDTIPAQSVYGAYRRNSRRYGYKYNYNYGYKKGYNYGYNYSYNHNYNYSKTHYYDDVLPELDESAFSENLEEIVSDTFEKKEQNT